MSGYDPTDFAHGIGLLRELLAEREAMLARCDDDRPILALFRGRIDSILGVLLADIEAVGGHSSAAGALHLELSRGQGGWAPLDVDRIEALHRDFALAWGAHTADTLKPLVAQKAKRARVNKKNQKPTRKRRSSHGVTVEQLLAVMEENEWESGQKNVRKLLPPAIKKKYGKHITESQLGRLITAAKKPRSSA